MNSLNSISDIGLFDPNINAYKFALAFNDHHMIKPISGIYEIKFISVWGRTHIPLKCGKIKIDFGLQVSVEPNVSEGKLLPQIDFVNPERPSKPNEFIIWIYLICLLVILIPFLKIQIYRKDYSKIKLVSYAVLVTSIVFLSVLFGSHFVDSVFETLPVLLFVLVLQAFTYNRMLVNL